VALRSDASVWNSGVCKRVRVDGVVFRFSLVVVEMMRMSYFIRGCFVCGIMFNTDGRVDNE
jgi:hypothetical protein